MGRRIPANPISTINPVISLSLLAGWIAVTIAIIGTLCAARSRKPSPTPSSSTRKSPKGATEQEASPATSMSSPAQSSTTVALEEPIQRIQEQEQQQQQPLSPKLKGSPSRLARSKQKLLSATLSMKLPGSPLSKIRTRKEGQQKQEESLWTKTIMLGEKCKVPDAEEDSIIYDQKGNRVASYRAKTPRSLPVSRTNSLLDQESIPFK